MSGIKSTTDVEDSPQGYQKLKEEDAEETTLIEKQKALGVYPFVAFVLVGAVELFGWNGLLNSSWNVCVFVWGLKDQPAMVTATYSISNAIMTVIAILYSDFFATALVTDIGIILTILDAVLFIIATYQNVEVGLILLYLVSFTMGVSSSLIGCSGFGYANYFPRNYAGGMSAGLGVAGVVTYAIWLLASQAIFDFTLPDADKVKDQVRQANAVLQGCGIVFALVSFGLLHFFFKNKDVKYTLECRKRAKQACLQRIKDGTATPEDIEEGSNSPSKMFHDIWETFWKVKTLALSIFVCMFVTLFAFPSIGPLGYNIPANQSKWKDAGVGAYQIGDLIGRYIPCIVPWMMFRTRGIVWLNVIRLLDLAFIILSWILPKVNWLHHPVIVIIQMLFLSITNGWAFTASLTEMPKQVVGKLAKARCAPIGLIGCVLGIAAGQWCSVLVTSYKPS